MKLIFPLVLALVALAGPAQAFPHITVTSCDTVQTSPLRVRTTFNVDFVGPGSWCWIDIFPLSAIVPGDPTQIYDGSGPVGWSSYSYGGGNGVSLFPPAQVCFGSGDHFTGFSLVADRPSPCAYIIFGQPLLLDAYDYMIQACLTADSPTAAHRTSWGGLKAVYRE